MTLQHIELTVKGIPVRVPAVEIEGRTVITTGRWLKVAAIHDEYWQESELEDPEAFLRELKGHRAKGFAADIFTFAQKFPNTTARHPYHMEWDNVAAIGLSSYEEWWKGLPSETRRNVRLAAKRGVTTQIQELSQELIGGIVEINNESPIRQGRRFHHYGKDAETVWRDYATFPERSTFIAAYHEEELIGFMKIVRVGKVAAILQLLSKTKHYDKKPANALIAKAVEHFAEKGASHLTYIKYRYGKKRKSPLTEFKKRNGFGEVLVPSYYVPLTAKGRTAVVLGLHRSLVEILPERLTDVLLEMRSKWYGWRSGTAA